MKRAPRNRKRNRRLRIFFAALLLAAVFAPGCSSATGDVSETPEGDPRLTVVHSPWEESFSLALLTEAILEEEFGYEVRLQRASPEGAFEALSSGRADVLQGIWRPAQNELIVRHEGGIDMLGQLLLGRTTSSLAAPSYMEIRAIEDLSGDEQALVLEEEASGVEEVPPEVFERENIETSTYSDAGEMLDEAESLYEDEEPFVMLAYSPHWMNLRFELDYLEDGSLPEGEGLLEEVNRPSTLHSAARSGLEGEDPVAHAFLSEMNLTVPQMESLQLAVRDGEDPAEAAREWAAANERVSFYWIRAAEAQAS